MVFAHPTSLATLERAIVRVVYIKRGTHLIFYFRKTRPNEYFILLRPNYYVQNIGLKKAEKGLFVFYRND